MKFILFTILLISTSCSGQFDKSEITDKQWATDIYYDMNSKEFTPNMILSFRDSIAFIHTFGTGNRIVESKFEIKEKKLFLDNNSIPFMKFIQVAEGQMLGSTFPGDTIRFREISQSLFSEDVIANKILNHSFILQSKNSGEEVLIHFGKNEVFYFSKDILQTKSDFPKLNYFRVPYFIDFTNGICTIVIGEIHSPTFKFLENGEIELLNLIIGKIDLFGDEEFSIRTMKEIGTEEYSLKSIYNQPDYNHLISGKWEFARGKGKIFNFKSSGELEIIEPNETSILNWRLDNSGYLIMMVDKFGEESYAILNFDLYENSIMFEFSKNQFVGLRNINR